jgi:hypothetical protein
MKTLGIDQPIKLGLGFWITYGVLALPAFLTTKSWLWDGPMYSRIAGLLLLPFLAAILVYSLFLFSKAVVLGGPKVRRNFWLFLAIMACAATFLWLCYLQYGPNHGYSYVGAIAAFSASLAYHRLRAKTPDQPPEAITSPGVNPPDETQTKTHGSN